MTPLVMDRIVMAPHKTIKLLILFFSCQKKGSSHTKMRSLDNFYTCVFVHLVGRTVAFIKCQGSDSKCLKNLHIVNGFEACEDPSDVSHVTLMSST